MKNQAIAFFQKTKDSGVLAFGKDAEFTFQGNWDAMDSFLETHKKSFIFSYISYDLKNSIEDLESSNTCKNPVPDFCAWVPKCVAFYTATSIHIIQGEKSEENKNFVKDFLQQLEVKTDLPRIQFQAQINKEKYIHSVENIRNEIQMGNVYEMNFCQEFFAENVDNLPSLSVFNALFNLTEAPYSCYLNTADFELFCGSPERFLQREGNTLLSQPIKGTIQRGRTEKEDLELIEQLANDPKEQAENVMITDLVRNDLSKIATRDSVHVDELFGIYTFKTVHHMISTISCQLKENTRFSEILKATFPMGSMTGAPKIAAMELIEKYESFKRGLYSGSVGYFLPEMNGKQHFDFNVVIRSLLYDKSLKTLTCSVGSAITIQSNPEKEYQECLVKVKRILQLFGDDQAC
jgi:para-aminobenzoate synthetase component I